MFTNNHFFNSKLNNISPKDLKISLDKTYKEFKYTSINDRLDIINKKIETVSPFLEEYNKYFKTSINCSEALSEDNNICKEIENWANYLLGAKEIREERKKSDYQYKFYVDKTEFNNLNKKEESLDGKIQYTNNKINNLNSNNDYLIIDFLIKKQQNKKKSKKVTICKSDFSSKNLYCSSVLRDYQKLIEISEFIIKDIKDNENSKYKGERYKYTRIKKDAYFDMLYCKTHLLGIFGEKLSNQILDSTVPSWDKFDWHEPSHIKELLFLQKEFNPDDDVSYLVLSLNELLKKMNSKNKFTKIEQKVIYLIRRNFNNKEISNKLKIHHSRVSHITKNIVKKIVEYTLDNWKVGTF